MRPPTIEDATVEVLRERLHHHLDRVFAQRVTVLRAPPGYGKSTAVRQSARRWRAAGAAVTILDRGSVALAEQIFCAVHAARAASVGVLVIDQLHEVAEAQWAPTVAEAVATIPPHLHLVLATRRALPPSVQDACQAAGHELLGSALFTFTREDCLRLLSAGSPLERAEALSAELHRMTGGWPIAVAAAVRGWQSREHFGALGEPSLLPGHFDGTTWDQYLRTEVLEAQPVGLRDFLRGSVLLGNISAELCDDVLGRRDSEAAIEELAAQELVTPIGGQRGWFQHHPLLAETLRDQGSGDERDWSRAIHRRAARWHADRQDRHRAMTHLLALGDYGAAAELVLGAPPARPVDDLAGLLAAAGTAQAARAVVPEGAAGGSPTLSARELEVLRGLAAGLANKEIARDLYVSVATVKAHIYNIFRKLRVTNRTAAVGTARRLGIVG